MKEILITQIQFEYWANTELLKNLKLAKPLHPRALWLFSHLLSVGSMWLNRLNYEPLTTTLFHERTVEECEDLLTNSKSNWNTYFKTATLEDLERVIEFVSPLDNVKRRIKINDAIMHIVHHSSYHRGQIISLLKGSVEQLPSVTYMPFASIEIE